MMDGWTRVLYGKRRQHARQQQWDPSYGGYYGGMDRAPFFSRKREYLPPPNRPVPPPGVPRGNGPQPKRSYAEAVRRRGPPTTRGWASPRTAGSEIKQQAADPKLSRLVRKMHSVIKTVHHLQNVTPKPGKSEPLMISRMVGILAEMIKPAVPTQKTVDLIIGNAKNWGYNTYLILQEHYERSLQELLHELAPLLTPKWKEAFEVSVRWAKRNLSRLTQDVIDQAEAMILATAIDPGLDQIPQQSVVPSQPKVPQQSLVKASVAPVTNQKKQVQKEKQNSNLVTEPPKEKRKKHSTLVTEPPREQKSSRRVTGTVPRGDNFIQQEQGRDGDEGQEEDEGLGVTVSPINHSTRLELEAYLEEEPQIPKNSKYQT